MGNMKKGAIANGKHEKSAIANGQHGKKVITGSSKYMQFLI